MRASHLEVLGGQPFPFKAVPLADFNNIRARQDINRRTDIKIKKYLLALPVHIFLSYSSIILDNMLLVLADIGAAACQEYDEQQQEILPFLHCTNNIECLINIFRSGCFLAEQLFRRATELSLHTMIAGEIASYKSVPD